MRAGLGGPSEASPQGVGGRWNDVPCLVGRVSAAVSDGTSVMVIEARDLSDVLGFGSYRGCVAAARVQVATRVSEMLSSGLKRRD
ncbi:MAG: hypothetical protein V3V08_20490 [Nannocystaceae bacterium]